MASDSSASSSSGARKLPAKAIGVFVVLLILAIVATVLAVSGNDTGDQATIEMRNEAQKQNPRATKRSSTGTIEAGGQQLIPIPAGALGPLVGESVSAENVTVQSANAKSGFWIGTSDAQRIFVAYPGGSAKGSAPGEADRLQIEGTIKKNPDDPRKAFGLAENDAVQLAGQGGYIAATSIKATGTESVDREQSDENQ